MSAGPGAPVLYQGTSQEAVIPVGFLVAHPTQATPGGDDVGEIGRLPDGTLRRPNR